MVKPLDARVDDRAGVQQVGSQRRRSLVSAPGDSRSSAMRYLLAFVIGVAAGALAVLAWIAHDLTRHV
ncbi:MAG: hypothetical protein JXB47_01815 [Anaerolineae bacterium]|nr:hypothetical protein [Anaerolineae bacterium]